MNNFNFHNSKLRNASTDMTASGLLEYPTVPVRHFHLPSFRVRVTGNATLTAATAGPAALLQFSQEV